MRILILASSYPPVLGGLQTTVQDLAIGLNKKGHSVLVVTERYPRSLAPKETMKGISVHRYLFLSPQMEYLRKGRWDLFFASLCYFPLTLWKLISIFREFSPEIVNFHFPDSQIPFALLLRKIFNFILVVSTHGDDVEKYFSGEGNGAKEMYNQPGGNNMKQLLRQADAVTSCSQHLSNLVVRLEPTVQHKIKVTYNGVNLERFENKKTFYRSRQYLFAFGRLTRKKGFKLLIEAFGKVSKAYPDIDLIIAGEGEDLKDLNQQAQREQLSGRVVFYGCAKPEEVVVLLNGCEAVVIPSKREPFGIVALEAMSAGKFILATSVGGLPEVLGNAAAQLVPPTKDAIAQGLEWILQNREEAQKRGLGNKRVALGYGVEAMMRGYEDVFLKRLENQFYIPPVKAPYE